MCRSPRERVRPFRGGFACPGSPWQDPRVAPSVARRPPDEGEEGAYGRLATADSERCARTRRSPGMHSRSDAAGTLAAGGHVPGGGRACPRPGTIRGAGASTAGCRGTRRRHGATRGAAGRLARATARAARRPRPSCSAATLLGRHACTVAGRARLSGPPTPPGAPRGAGGGRRGSPRGRRTRTSRSRGRASAASKPSTARRTPAGPGP